MIKLFGFFLHVIRKPTKPLFQSHVRYVYGVFSHEESPSHGTDSAFIFAEDSRRSSNFKPSTKRFLGQRGICLCRFSVDLEDEN